jgi:hypothetical protein
MRKKRQESKGLDLTIYTKNGTLRKRKPKTSRNYFTQETEDAIVAYTKTDNQRERNRLFNEYINDSIHKLAENIIHTFKFYYTDLDNVEDLKHEVVYFLIEQFHKYDQTQGKAYSYFGTIAKRYLIVYNDKQYKLQKDRREMDHVDEDKKVLRAAQEEQYDQEVSHFVQSYVRFIEENIDEIHENRYYKTDPVTKHRSLIKEYITFTEKDKAIVYTVLDLFKKADELDVFYKPALYLLIREATGQKTIDITRVIKIMKCVLEQQAKIYYRKGALDIKGDDIYSSINMIK